MHRKMYLLRTADGRNHDAVANHKNAEFPPPRL
jgi:hypothetical protein